jgi:multidrug efflux pump
MRFAITGFGGANSAFAGFGLVPWAERERSQAEVQGEVQGKLGGVAGVQAFVFAPPTLREPGRPAGSACDPLHGNPAQVFEVAEEIKNRGQASGRFIVVQNSMSYSQPQVRVTIDRDRAAALGVAVSEIGSTLTTWSAAGRCRSSTGGPQLRHHHPGGQENRLNPENLTDYYVRSASGSMVPLSAVVSWRRARLGRHRAVQPAEFRHHFRLPLPGSTSGGRLAALREIARR